MKYTFFLLLLTPFAHAQTAAELRAQQMPLATTYQDSPMPSNTRLDMSTGNRFYMQQNGKQMTADDFDEWMARRGIRMVGATPRVAPAYVAQTEHTIQESVSYQTSSYEPQAPYQENALPVTEEPVAQYTDQYTGQTYTIQTPAPRVQPFVPIYTDNTPNGASFVVDEQQTHAQRMKAER